MLGFAALICSGAMAQTAQTDDLDVQLARVRRELTQVNAQTQRVQADMERDREEFNQYQVRNKKRFDELSTDIALQKKELENVSKTGDSLGALIGSKASKKKQIALAQDELRTTLQKSCDSLSAQMILVPPLLCIPMRQTLLLLKSELTGQTIDNVEAAGRLWRIFADLEEAAMSVSVSQEPSPVADIRGETSRLRVGLLFEGVVDAAGSACAIWQGYDASGAAIWRTVSDAAIAAHLRVAINIRDGKALPAFVTLPIGFKTATSNEVAQ